MAIGNSEKKKRITHVKTCLTAVSVENYAQRYLVCTNTFKCKKASCEEFGQYSNSIWDDVPQNLNDVEQQPLPHFLNEPELELEDFYLEEDIQIVEEMFNREETDLLPLPPPPTPPQQDELCPQACHRRTLRRWSTIY